MDETAQAAKTIANFLQTFISTGNLRLRFRVKLRGQKTATSEPAPPDPRDLYVEFVGPDTPVLTARNGEVLNSLEHVASKILRLESEEHHRVIFDADHFKANRELQLKDLAETAIARVRSSEQPYAFPPMSSRERRHLHLLLAEAGLPTASSGEGAARLVVLYPAGANPEEEDFAAPAARRPDPEGVRRAFRHR
jgi:spoIIIJ-associated protein